MVIIGRKEIAIALWVRIAIALWVAAVLTFAAFLLTMDSSGRIGGQAAIPGAILLLPVALAAKAGWPSWASLTFAFSAYFCICFLGVWFSTRQGRAA